MAEQPVIRLSNCSFRYDGRSVLDDVSLSVRRGEVVVVAGPNGAGKTTLLRLVAGVLTPDEGRVEIEGRQPRDMGTRALARRVAVVPQEAHFAFPYKVGEFVRMGRTPYLGFSGFESEADVAAADKALAFCDLTTLATRFITQLSGGELQRAVIARALAQEPALLLLDEPTRSLDLRHTQEILSILRRIRADTELSVVMVSHDLNLASGFADRVVLLSGGRVVEDGVAGEVLVPAKLDAVFGVRVEILRGSEGQRVVVPTPR